MKKLILVIALITVIVLTLTAMPAVILADDEPGGTIDVYPGCTTTIKLHTENILCTEVILWVFKFDGSFEDLIQMDDDELSECIVYGPRPSGGNGEGLFFVESYPWEKNIELKLSSGHYIAASVYIGIAEEGEEEFIIIKEFNVSGCNEEEDKIIPWVRDVEMTCYQVWINKDNNFEFVFWWEYANNNWVKIYNMAGNEVFSIDMAYGAANFIADLPVGMYTVKTFHDGFETPIQEFLIGKP